MVKLTVIVKPTHTCNMACRYCYLDHQAEQGMMDYNILENLVNKTLENHDSVHFIWHGGEPLLISLDFYKRAAELQNRYKNKRVSNGFQSNGTLVTDEILDFCAERHFDIGFSLDGPKEINDRTRYFADGTSSFEKTLTAIKKAQERKVGGGAIVVINRFNIDHLDEIYAFAQRESINLKLNPLIKSGNAKDNYLELGIGPKEYGQAMVKLFDQWFYDDSHVKLDPFEELMGNLLTGQPWGCNYSVSCQNSFISVGPQGDVYPCGRFDGVEGFKLGNINTDSLSEILSSEKRKRLQERTAEIKSCEKCEHKSICNAGCMHNAYMRRGNIHDKDYYCSSYKILFSHIAKAMDRELAKAEVK